MVSSTHGVLSDRRSCDILRDYIYIFLISQDCLWQISINNVIGDNHIYHLHTNLRIVMNFSGSIPLVNMSAFCRRVSTLTSVIPLLSPQWCLKKCYLTLMCFVRGVIFIELAVVSAPLFSLKTVDLITAVSPPPSFIVVNIYKSRRRIGTSSRISWLREIYSALVVLIVISVWILELHIMEHPPSVRTYPVLYFKQTGSWLSS